MPAKGSPERFDLSGLVSRSTPLLSASIPREFALSLTHPRTELLIEADPRQIEQILMNLVINAAEAIPPKPTAGSKYRPAVA
jgi:signal transduction histidine kinase